jgi:hypothetical protein
MASALDVIRAVNPPRAAFLDFPLGHTTGKPHDPGVQREIMVQALNSITGMTGPGSVATLDFRWSDTDDWKENIILERKPRYDTPQYQSDEDRIRAEAINP